VEVEVIARLCSLLEMKEVRDSLADEIINILNNLATDKIKIEFLLKRLNMVLIKKATIFN
jgi:hypothetical protein